MCLGIHFTSQTCRHRDFRVRKCSSPGPCNRALSFDEHRHIGECPICLGGLFWPPQSYEQFPNMCTRLGPVRDRVATVQVYIEDLVNTLSLAALTELGRIPKHAASERGGATPSFTPHVMYRVMETIYREAYCLVCDRKDGFGRIPPCPHNTSGQDITTHEASRIAGQATNTVAQFRVEVAREAWGTNFSVKVEADVDFQTWATSDILQRNHQQEQLLWQRPSSTRRTVDHTWPLTAIATADRYRLIQSKTRAFLDSLFRICQQTNAKLTGAGDGTYESAVYMEVGGQTMDLATWVVANDPGVPEGQFDVVARALVKMAIHPKTSSADTDTVSSWIWDQMPTLRNPDLTVYDAVLTAWVAGVREEAVEKMNGLVVRATRRLCEIRYWQTVNQNGKMRALVGARVDFHSVRVPSFVLNRGLGQGVEGWKCMICWDGVEGDAAGGGGGGVIQLALCGHDLHRACMVRHVGGGGGLGSNSSNTRCPYCRQEFDGLPAGNEGVQGRLRGEMKVEPRPRNDFVMAGMTPDFVDAVDQGGLSLGLWGGEGQGDVAVDVGEEEDETDDEEEEEEDDDDDDDDADDEDEEMADDDDEEEGCPHGLYRTECGACELLVEFERRCQLACLMQAHKEELARRELERQEVQRQGSVGLGEVERQASVDLGEMVERQEVERQGSMDLGEGVGRQASVDLGEMGA